MIGVRTRVTRRKDIAGAFDRGLRKGLLDVGQKGFNATQEKIASEATDEGNLFRSGYGPEVDESTLSIIWGYAAPYAKPVDEGTVPHWAPIAPLIGWARRVLGDESAAYAVQRKIAEEGTEGIHFVKEGVDTMKAALASKGLRANIEEEL